MISIVSRNRRFLFAAGAISLSIGAVMAVSGCATVAADVAVTQADVTAACGVYEGALEGITLLEMAGVLSATVISDVDKSNTLVSPLCAPGAISVNPVTDLQTVQNELTAINSLKPAAATVSPAAKAALASSVDVPSAIAAWQAAKR